MVTRFRRRNGVTTDPLAWAIGIMFLIGPLLTGCQPWEGTGVVRRLDYEPSRVVYDDVCLQYDTENSFMCRVEIQVPRTIPEKWRLRVEDPATGEVHRVTVPESTWTRCRVGQSFSTDTQRCAPR